MVMAYNMLVAQTPFAHTALDMPILPEIPSDAETLNNLGGLAPTLGSASTAASVATRLRARRRRATGARVAIGNAAPI